MFDQSYIIKPPFGIRPDSAYISKNGIVGWWLMNECGGTVLKDISGRNNVGALIGPTWTGSVLNFNGSNTYVNLGNVQNIRTSDLTVSFRMKTTYSGTGTMALVSKSFWGAQVGRWAFYVDSGNLTIFLQMDSVLNQLISVPQTLINNGTWHTVSACAKRTGYMNLYVDGALVGSPVDISAYSGVDMQTSDSLFFGAYNDESGSAPKAGTFFNGQLDDVRIYNRALSPQEIKNLYLIPFEAFSLRLPGFITSASAIKTLSGLAYSSVKTFNGLAIGSIKTVNSLA